MLITITLVTLFLGSENDHISNAFINIFWDLLWRHGTQRIQSRNIWAKIENPAPAPTEPINMKHFWGMFQSKFLELVWSLVLFMFLSLVVLLVHVFLSQCHPPCFLWESIMSSVMSISPSVSCLPFRSPVSPPCFLFLVSLVSHVHPCVLHSPSWLCVPHSFVLCISSVCLVPMSVLPPVPVSNLWVLVCVFVCFQFYFDIFSSCVQCVQFLFPCLLFIPAVFPMCFLSP